MENEEIEVGDSVTYLKTKDVHTVKAIRTIKKDFVVVEVDSGIVANMDLFTKVLKELT